MRDEDCPFCDGMMGWNAATEWPECSQCGWSPDDGKGRRPLGPEDAAHLFPDEVSRHE